MPPIDDEDIPIKPTSEMSDEAIDYFSGSEGSTQSLTPTDYICQYENGRRYHCVREGKYFLPNDEKELKRYVYLPKGRQYFFQRFRRSNTKSRLDNLHHMYLMLLDGALNLAPFSKENPPNRVLDLGTGTGVWAIDIADIYPAAEVIGIDLCPIQPRWVAPNCRFEIEDVENDWTFSKESFDFIHSRHLQGAITDWQAYVVKIYRYISPGGYVELCEVSAELIADDGTYPPNCRMKEYLDKCNEANEMTGRRAHVAPRLKEYCWRAGFSEITEYRKKLPWSPWPKDGKWKELGQWALEDLEEGIEAHALALFTRVLGMEAHEALKLCSDALAELKSGEMHVYNWQ
ncbi:hypothetical protein RUND412_001578 [Rhizina undulata]